MSENQHVAPIRVARSVMDEREPQSPSGLAPGSPSLEAERGVLIERRATGEHPALQSMPWDAPAYEEPPLVDTSKSALLVIVARWALALWAIVSVVATFALRSRAAEGSVDTDVVSTIAWSGVAVCGANALFGWWWSDRHTVNIHRLGGRLPGRLRCVTAWAIPLVVVSLASAVVERSGPTEDVDVRKVIAVCVFVVAMWRPYSLCRRLIRSLTRVDADALVGTAFVFDIAGFGLMWWQLTSWPDSLDPSSVGTVDPLVGLASAGAVALVANAMVWTGVIRTLKSALLHRRVARRTQHDHRQLRARGIDPMDPAVRWALLEIRREELREAGGDERVLGDRADVPSGRADVPGDRADVPSGRADVPGGRALSDHRDAEAGDDEVESIEPVGHANLRSTRAWDGSDDDDRSDAPDTVHPGQPVSRLEQRWQGSDTRPDPSRPGSRPADVEAERLAGDTTPPVDVTVGDLTVGDLTVGDVNVGDVNVGDVNVGGPAPSDGGIGAEARLRRLADQYRRSADANTDRSSSPLDRIPGRLQPDDVSAEHRRPDRLAAPLAESGDVRAPVDLIERLARFGITPGAVPAPGDPAESLEPHRPVMKRVFHLEAVRVAVLVAMVVTTGVGIWLVVASGSAEVEGQRILAGSVESIDAARRTLFACVVVTAVCVVVWALAVVVSARRCDVRVDRLFGRVLATLVISAVLVGVVSVLDRGRGPASLAAVTLGVLGSVVAIATARRVGVSLAGSQTSLWVWIVLMLLIPVALFAGRFGQPVRADAALQSMLFAAAVLSMVLGVAVVVAAVATGAIEERIRIAAAGSRMPSSIDRPRGALDPSR